MISFSSRFYKILEDRIKLIHGECIEKCKEIPSASVDLIFTDPPYNQESLYLYGELAKIASRVLKEGGSLVTFQVNYYLPQVLDQLKLQDLNYWWQICVKYNGGHSSVFDIRVNVKWKSLLWLVKGAKPLPTFQSHNINDIIESQDPDKTLHDWAQSTIEAEYYTTPYPIEDQTVLDHFMGYGTTAIAALNLKRKFIGIELDETHLS